MKFEIVAIKINWKNSVNIKKLKLVVPYLDYIIL